MFLRSEAPRFRSLMAPQKKCTHRFRGECKLSCHGSWRQRSPCVDRKIATVVLGTEDFFSIGLNDRGTLGEFMSTRGQSEHTNYCHRQNNDRSRLNAHSMPRLGTLVGFRHLQFDRVESLIF
eukprot:SAG31_NODE_5004_length_2807_cov_1.624446_5_plen_122_part_00